MISLKAALSISSVQFSSVIESRLTLCYPMDCSTPGLPVYHQLPEFTQTHVHELVMPSKYLILYCPLLLLSSIFPASGSFQMSQFFASRGQSIGSFSFSISPSNEYSGLISFRMDWLDPAVQVTLKNSSKVPIRQCSAFIIVQLSHPYMTTGKTIALTRWTLVSKVMSLLFNMLSRFVITFLPRSKCLLILWLQSPSAEILEPPEIKSVTVSTVSPAICHEVMGPDAMILVF